jgi:tRNA splicing ligase
MFGFITYREWSEEYFGPLSNLYDIYTKYRTKNTKSFDEFCIIIFKSDFNIKT